MKIIIKIKAFFEHERLKGLFDAESVSWMMMKNVKRLKVKCYTFENKIPAIDMISSQTIKNFMLLKTLHTSYKRNGHLDENSADEET